MSDTRIPDTQAVLCARSLSVAYDARQIMDGLNVSVPAGKISVIVGPNACGKSTLLKALSRLLLPTSGSIVLDGQDIRCYGSRDLARKLGLLPQSATAPGGMRVVDLVARGRYPHQGMFRQWSDADEAAVNRAMQEAHVAELAYRSVDELSGGQRQRVWLALVLAQETPVMLLDEPTTYLDIAHQLEVLELCRRLNRQGSRTLVMVLHDLNQAARYADHLIAMKSGVIIATGTPQEVLTPSIIETVFGIRAVVIPDPVTATPMVVPVAIAKE